MTLPADAKCLPDVNVWIAIVADRHEHHATARQWFDSVSVPVCFCRVTQMAFLRLLTNPKVMGEDILRRSRRSASTVSLLPMNGYDSRRSLRTSRAPGFP